jgi:hypothetical protein
MTRPGVVPFIVEGLGIKIFFRVEPINHLAASSHEQRTGKHGAKSFHKHGNCRCRPHCCFEKLSELRHYAGNTWEHARITPFPYRARAKTIHNLSHQSGAVRGWF